VTKPHQNILGPIHRSPSDTGDGLATIGFESRQIEVRIMPEDEPFEVAANLAAEVAGQLHELDTTARRIIVANLLRKYNTAWREYDEVQEDGSLQTVSNPQLSETEFAKKFSLSAVNVTGNTLVELSYGDSGLFGGHSVVVTSFAGTDFREASAELYG